jgi:type VI secretion system Hcp family effector
MFNSLHKHLAAALVIVVAAIASTAHAANARIQLTIETTKQGVIKQIPATALTVEIKSPRDLATGQASGKLQSGAATITKSVDGASTQLFQALVTNEVLKSVTIDFYSTNANGEEAVAQSIRLTNATVSNLRQYLDATPQAASLPLQEDVSFTYQKFEFVGPGGSPAPTESPAPAAPAAAPAPAATPAKEPTILQPVPAARRRRPAPAQPAPPPP